MSLESRSRFVRCWFTDESEKENGGPLDAPLSVSVNVLVNVLAAGGDGGLCYHRAAL